MERDLSIDVYGLNLFSFFSGIREKLRHIYIYINY